MPATQRGAFARDEAIELIESGQQRRIKRNWKFSIVPATALFMALTSLVWELIRQNMPADQWPWTVATLGVAPAATLSGLFLSLILAREQFARSSRPNLSWSSHGLENKSVKGNVYTATLMNAGPGIANVAKATYSLEIQAGGECLSVHNANHKAAQRVLRQAGLVDGVDFHLELLTGGAPLPVAKNRTDGIEFAAFSKRAIVMCQRIDFAVSVIDTMGDEHLKSMPFLATLPQDVLTPDDTLTLFESSPDQGANPNV